MSCAQKATRCYYDFLLQMLRLLLLYWDHGIIEVFTYTELSDCSLNPAENTGTEKPVSASSEVPISRTLYSFIKSDISADRFKGLVNIHI